MNPLQRAAVRRKAYYFGAILVLFTVSMLWRGLVPVPLSSTARAGEPPTALHRVADRLADRTIQSQAQRLELRELEQGDPELAGATVRLMLTGSRGLAVTLLWTAAIEKQKRNDFHEFELLVRQVTNLQPHFITPWIFQSWNIAYNVSVEQDKLNDMYFYIARGIELLAEGERRNKRSPDMRYQLGFYYQNKFGVSDKVQTLRCLMQLSCLPPNDRNPNNFVRADGSIDLAYFRQFCEKNPHLVRRLREKLNCRKPEDVVAFLRDNRAVPTRYKPTGELADPDKQFPALPPRFEGGEGEAHPGMTTGDDFSGFRAARAWFAYANLLVPPNPRDAQGRPIPSPTPRPGTGPGEYDPFKYRVPRLPMLIIFRQGPPRAQSYQADLEQKEGWFDDEGWRIDEGVDPSNQWFPGEEVVVGKERPWSRQEWEEAARLWTRHGEEYALSLDPARLSELRREAGETTGPPPDLTRDQWELLDPATRRRYEAQAALYFYTQNRSVTNFPYFLHSSQAEARPETVQARKTLWQAEQARKAGNKLRAITLYEDGLKRWRQVLLDNPDFHRPDGQGERTEEDTFEYELEYLRLIVQDDPRVRQRFRELGSAARAVVPFLPDPAETGTPLLKPEVRDELLWHVAEREFSPLAGLVPTGYRWEGTPWVRADVKDTVRTRQGVQRRAPTATPPGASAGLVERMPPPPARTSDNN